MVSKIIDFNLRHKVVALMLVLALVGVGLFSLSRITIGAVPDVTNNQVQVITTSRNLATQDMEQFITYPVELEMANLPGVEEIRSISKFGLSVVTIVFDDAMGTYLPRQLIAEKIKSATEKIPEGFGTPEMGPISTGLGEIYQYTLDLKPGYGGTYSPMELRTLQDWVVKRQLSGIPGVVEVNTWGGYLKQYEVALNSQKMNAMAITAEEVFKALSSNNGVAGGSYIEKRDQAYFIRAEGLITNLDDIGNVVVKTRDGLPIYIRDVAQVGFGKANRFGAITGNGSGEKVLGQVMMLKDANSKEVIGAVKERVDQIAKTLPEGVFINPIVDRSELIARTTFTVTENLVLGCLIVIFVVVLLLGNIRSGLVVASVIPLSLLFALSMMYLFGIDANLMSLGAIDFGIIIDGAVIIVEYITFQMARNRSMLKDSENIGTLKDELVRKGTQKMMTSAIFGQIIILIVFIPIVTLSGVEGKMFKPMALTFGFALIGAIFLCFTYVPVAASLFLRPPTDKPTFSAKIIGILNKGYDKIIDRALGAKKQVLAMAMGLFVVALFIFARMGAEFVPTLDEGDFVIQPVLPTGTSLGKTIEITTQIETILMNSFPEVRQVVSRIGAAEVPTDPMSMEESDVIISLKPKREWTSASTKDELANKFKEALSVIPNMEVEFTQPIEMRFNELITGVRTDIAIKIFGEDLNVLAQKGEEIGKLIAQVPGAADISVEKTDGLPQMRVVFNRAKIARYGLNIAEVNHLITMAFAGADVGSIYEGEKRFDLVLRLQSHQRNEIDDLKRLYVDLPHGGKVPLTELATVDHTQGAARISRDDTRRRVVVGVNVRDRDLQSVVDEIQNLIDSTIELPVGYSITFGGQFENLQRAKERLLIAVPLALGLIFLMLYLAFKSLRKALIIYSAIPLAAVGGVVLLWIRGMPFSISAGVGFIALFGIAVLNGIVLMEHFKELQNKEFESMDALIKEGAKDRLRAVLLTALAAALGFLPMAVSTNAGAEVQRPLATVVIGGLITATLLTLVVLPVLYALFLEHKKSGLSGSNVKWGSVIVLSLLGGHAMAQDTTKSLEELESMALLNNAELKTAVAKAETARALVVGAYNFDKTQLYYSYDQNNLAMNNKPLNVFGIAQDFEFPTVYFARRKVNKAHYLRETSLLDIERKKIRARLRQLFYRYQVLRQKEAIYRELDSLYKHFSQRAHRRFELGETNYLEKVTAQSTWKKMQVALQRAEQHVKMARDSIGVLVQAKEPFEIEGKPPVKLLLSPVQFENLPEMTYLEKSITHKKAQVGLARQAFLPDVGFEYFQGTNSNLGDHLYGYQMGIKIPLLFSGQRAKLRAAKQQQMATMAQSNLAQIQLQAKYQMLLSKLENHKKYLAYYETEGNKLAEEILKMAEIGFKNGEIDFFQYIQSIGNAQEIQLGYLDELHNYNKTIIEIEHLSFN